MIIGAPPLSAARCARTIACSRVLEHATQALPFVNAEFGAYAGSVREKIY